MDVELTAWVVKNEKKTGRMESDFESMQRYIMNEQDPVGPSWVQTPPTLHAPHLLFVKKALASYSFPEFQRANLIREVRK